MATFNAQVVGSSLNYDFTKWGGTSGIIPEPSDDQLDTFFDRIDEIAGESDMEPAEGDSEAAEQLVDDLSLKEANKHLVEAVSDLCSQSPSAAQLNSLPPRVRQTFFKWIMKQVQDPELSAPGTTTSRKGRKGA